MTLQVDSTRNWGWRTWTPIHFSDAKESSIPFYQLVILTLNIWVHVSERITPTCQWPAGSDRALFWSLGILMTQTERGLSDFNVEMFRENVRLYMFRRRKWGRGWGTWTQRHRMSEASGMCVSSVQSLYLTCGKLRPEREEGLSQGDTRSWSHSQAYWLEVSGPVFCTCVLSPLFALISDFCPLASLTDLDFGSWLWLCSLLSTFGL